MTDHERENLLHLLTGIAAGDMLSTAVAASGGRLLNWRPTHVEHRPGRATVSFRTSVQWNGTAVVRTETLCATAGEPLPADVVVVGDGQSRVGIWRLPHEISIRAFQPASQIWNIPFCDFTIYPGNYGGV
jgi:hypothetical protein